MHWFAQIGGDDSLALSGMLGLSSACFDNDCVTCVWNSLFATWRESPRLMYLMRRTSKTETAFQSVPECIFVRRNTSNLSEVINYEAKSDVYRNSSFITQRIIYDLCC